MSEVKAFDRDHFGSGEEPSAGWPFHSEYEPLPTTDRHESELTAGFAIEPGRHYGFLTDTTVCIGCKACEVACKEWNNLPADEMEFLATSYDNTHDLGHDTWRHVKFIEQPAPAAQDRTNSQGLPRWLFQSDICKHCEHAGCLEACPTGAIIRTEFGTVVIQQDICNGCQYCVPSCPYGVITVGMKEDGKAHKCTLCYDRLKGGMEPACAKACPTDSIQFGPVETLVGRAQGRVEALHDQGFRDAQLYGDPGGIGATNGIRSLRSFFLLMDHPNVYNLPEAPILPSRNIVPGLLASLATATVLIGATALSLLGGRRSREEANGA
jgi:formate dehydrogenase iron-sulfur subunit